MSHYDYQASKRLALLDAPFYSLIMAAMRQADSNNQRLLAGAWPDVWAELRARYDAPGGFLPSDACTHTEVSPEHLYACCRDGFDCDECGQPATSPVRDPEQVAYLGDRARVFCSAKCLADAAERQGSR